MIGIIYQIIKFIMSDPLYRVIAIIIISIIGFIVLVNVLSKFLQNLDILAILLKKYINLLLKLIFFIISWIFKFAFLPITLHYTKKYISKINGYIINNSQFKRIN